MAAGGSTYVNDGHMNIRVYDSRDLRKSNDQGLALFFSR
jgi:hypothetical protein